MIPFTFPATPLQSKEVSFFRTALVSILGYEAAGATLGGILLILKPGGELMDMPVSMLQGYFKDFFVPGLILLGLGLLTTASFIAVIRRSSIDWLMALISLCGFAIWFVTEIVILQEVHWLHLMWGLPIVVGLIVVIPLLISRSNTDSIQPWLLAAGIVSSLWYVAINIYVPTLYNGYSLSDLTVSELSAVGSPTRLLWLLLVWLYPVLFAAFGFGVIERSRGNRALRTVGILIVAYCFFNLYWPPMHMRGEGRTLSDLLHILWGVVTVLLMIAMMITGAVAIKGPFRVYTIISIITHIVFGALTFEYAGNIATNGPTPMIGTWERINIAVFMLWVIVLAWMLLTNNKAARSSSLQIHQ